MVNIDENIVAVALANHSLQVQIVAGKDATGKP